MPDRPLRICDLCGQVDDHPRHVIALPPGSVPVDEPLVAKVKAMKSISAADRDRIVADVEDTTQQQRHMDCCRLAGCFDGSCGAIGAAGGADLRGPALTKHLTSGKVDHLTSGQEA